MFPFEQGAFEMVVIGALALIIVGPKDLPVLMRRVGQFTAKMRGMAAEFRASFDELARQSELDELRREVEALRTGASVNPFAADHGGHAASGGTDLALGEPAADAPPYGAPYAAPDFSPPIGGESIALPHGEATAMRPGAQGPGEATPAPASEALISEPRTAAASPPAKARRSRAATATSDQAAAAAPRAGAPARRKPRSGSMAAVPGPIGDGAAAPDGKDQEQAG